MKKRLQEELEKARALETWANNVTHSFALRLIERFERLRRRGVAPPEAGKGLVPDLVKPGVEADADAGVSQARRNSKLPNFLKSYDQLTKRLLQTHTREHAMSLAVGGGDFEAIGLLEYHLLTQYGLKKNDIVIDVGCGSGRLAFQLSRHNFEGDYIGVDIVQDLFEYAMNLCKRPDWKFYKAPGLTIPEPDESADFICFFSVFTHLLHEETFLYLKDTKRVLKPNGKIIFSFLEFSIPSHWWIFESSLVDRSPDKVLNQFVSRDAIQAWASHLELRILEINDGDKPHINLPQPVRFDDGREMVEKGHLGQSVCVLTKVHDNERSGR